MIESLDMMKLYA